MKIIHPSFEILHPVTQQEWIKEAKLIELAARNCYKSEDKITDDSYKTMIKMLIEKDHMAMIEFGNFVCRIITDRGITHELVRHRLASYAQESTRYCNYGKDKFGKEITVVAPSGVTNGSTNALSWETSCMTAEQQYFKMLEEGFSPQIARSVLPTCLKTEIIMKCNFRELLHIFKMRCSPAAHPDIRKTFLDIRQVCRGYLPEVFE